MWFPTRNVYSRPLRCSGCDVCRGRSGSQGRIASLTKCAAKLDLRARELGAVATAWDRASRLCQGRSGPVWRYSETIAIVCPPTGDGIVAGGRSRPCGPTGRVSVACPHRIWPWAQGVGLKLGAATPFSTALGTERGTPESRKCTSLGAYLFSGTPPKSGGAQSREHRGTAHLWSGHAPWNSTNACTERRCGVPYSSCVFQRHLYTEDSWKEMFGQLSGNLLFPVIVGASRGIQF